MTHDVASWTKNLKQQDSAYLSNMDETVSLPGKTENCNEEITQTEVIGKTYVENYKTNARQQRFLCKKCPKSFSCKKILNAHKVTHSEMTAAKNPKFYYGIMHISKPYSCKVCQLCFRFEKNLKLHELVHSKPYRCSLCLKCFSTQENLHFHKQGRHSKIKKIILNGNAQKLNEAFTDCSNLKDTDIGLNNFEGMSVDMEDKSGACKKSVLNLQVSVNVSKTFLYVFRTILEPF